MSILTSLRFRLRDEYVRIANLDALMRNQRVSASLSRGAATSALRSLDTSNPLSWEFSGFSQNREDGIIDFLCRSIKNPNRYFIEIGASTGQENNSSWLAVALRYSGLMVEGDPHRAKTCQRFLEEFSLGATVMCLFIEPESASHLCAMSLYQDPDFFSLDIDGSDYFVLKALLEAGLRPKIIAVEYNSVFGPDRPMTIRYRPSFNYLAFHDSGLYYGVSAQGWRALLGRYGYKFVTTESNGVNAFFIDPTAFEATFVDNLRGAPFHENFYQRMRFRTTWEAQFALIETLDFEYIS